MDGEKKAHNYARIVNYRGKRPGKRDGAPKIKTRGKALASLGKKKRLRGGGGGEREFLKDATERKVEECRRGVPLNRPCLGLPSNNHKISKHPPQ